MKNLETVYLGLKLKSPVIAGSSSITSSVNKMKEAEESGAGAIVLKSLFEEQILHTVASTPGLDSYAESDDYISYYTRSNAVNEYLELIAEAKRSLSIPVIASINCHTSETWIDFARNVEAAGADALEVNIYFIPVNKKTSPGDTEVIYLKLAEKLKKSIKIPVAVKIGPVFSNVLWTADQLYSRGVSGLVMFNRFYEPDIDVEKMELISSQVFSNRGDRRYVLRWIALTSAMDIRLDISATTGVYTGEDAVRYILAGATTVQVCSVLYDKGVSYISKINAEISDWMDRKGFKSLEEFRGKLSYKSVVNPSRFERSQFMKYFSSYH
jgi:dihydroorotate dehydrogenase (fumarate)